MHHERHVPCMTKSQGRKNSAEKISILSVIGGSSISVLSPGLVARRTKGAVAPGRMFFGGAELWVSNTSQGSKSAVRMQEMPFQSPKFQNISGAACPRTPLD